MENQKMPEYETIRAAVAGEKWAVEKVVECYKDEIDRLSTVAVRQPDGSTKQEINEDMRQSITKKLIEALPQFPLEEMEREEKTWKKLKSPALISSMRSRASARRRNTCCKLFLQAQCRNHGETSSCTQRVVSWQLF